jgi:hypothetical protein
VRSELVNVLDFIAAKPQTEDQVAALLATVLEREDIQSNLQEMLIQSVEHTLAEKLTEELFATFLVRVVGNQQLKDVVYESLFYSPIKRLFRSSEPTKNEATKSLEEVEIVVEEQPEAEKKKSIVLN